MGSSVKIGEGVSIAAILLLLPLLLYYITAWPFVTLWRWIAKKEEISAGKKALAIAMCAIIITSAVTACVDLYWSSQEGVPLNAYTMRGETPPPAMYHQEPVYEDSDDEPPAIESDAALAAQPPVMVWVSSDGDKYHRDSGCSGMKDAYQVTADSAVSMGRTACKKCY
mgnify:CR=1 FL=1